MPFVADDLGAWMVSLLADAGRKRLTTWVLGTEQERALRQVATAAVSLTAGELRQDNGALAAELALVISQVFSEPAPDTSLPMQSTLLEALQAGIAEQLAVLDDASLTGTGRSSAQVLELSVATLADSLTNHLVREIVVRGSRGGPLEPLAAQLNHDVTHLQGQRLEGRVGQLADEVRQALSRLDAVRSIPPSSLRRRRGLPGAPPHLFGRRDEVAELMRLIGCHDPGGAAVAMHAIDGMPGVGKTALVLHVAHLVADRYPDGAIFLDLTGYHPDLPPMTTEGALRHLLLAAGVPDDRIPEEVSDLRATWQREAADRRMLVVLDNAVDSGQVAPLLPAAAGCLVLVTSRRALYALPGVRPFPLQTLSDRAALELLRSVAGAGVDQDEGAARRIVTLCGSLPLALLIAGAMLTTPGYHPAALADDLDEERHALEQVPLADRDSSLRAAVHASIIVSYQRMPADLRPVFQICGLFPGPELSAPALAAMADEPGADDREARITERGTRLAQQSLRELANRSLLILTSIGEFGARWRQHDLVRASARACLRDEPLVDAGAPVTRLMDAQETTLRIVNSWWYGIRPSDTQDGALLKFADQAQTRRWVVAERANLLASVDSGLPGAGPIAQYLGPMLRDIDVTMTGEDDAGAATAPLDRYADARRCFEIQYQTAEHRDGPVDRYQTHALRQMANLDCQVARYERARQRYREAEQISRAGDDHYGLAMSLKGLGVIGRLTDDYPLAAASFREAIALLEPFCDRAYPQRENAAPQWADAMVELADVESHVHRFDDALALLARAAELQQELGNDLGLARVYWHQGDLLRGIGEFGAARERFNAALALYRKLERPDMAANAQWGLAQIEKDSGDPTAATAMFAELVALWRTWGNDVQHARMLLGQADAERLGEQWQEARRHFEQARELCVRCEDREGEAESHEGLARIAAATGAAFADAHLSAAIALYSKIGHPKASELAAYRSTGIR